MKTNAELSKEYQEFVVKVKKASNDFNDAVNGLSPENLKRFKAEIRTILPAGLVQLIKNLQD